MRKIAALVCLALMGAALVAPGSQADNRSRLERFVVLFDRGTSRAEMDDALRLLEARPVTMNEAVGMATVVAPEAGFTRKARATDEVFGVSRHRPIGKNPAVVHKRDLPASIQRQRETSLRRARARNHLGEDPLFAFQWNLRMLDAGPGDSYEISRGDEDVIVGVIDDGIAARHPDIGSNFDAELSRNFTRDIPSIDGPCRREPDKSCDDPVTTDEGGHGTWVATTIAGAENRFGILGVAPEVTLVNLRAGQDSGYFFLQPTVDALTYAADNGVDVVNMSFFTDPWLYNCRDNPADSEAAQMEQRTVIEATQRAVDYARDHDVTMITAIGNEFTDLGHPEIDVISPDYPPGAAYEREVDNDCLQMPTEADGVVAVSGIGPSGRKSWLSSYGIEQTDVAAPSGDSFDETLPYPKNMVVSGYTKPFLREIGLINRKGKPTVPDVLRRCRNREEKKRCGYYWFAEGTSIASPAAAGVAALIVSEFGEEDEDGGITMDPTAVEAILRSSAVDHDCPEGGVQEYPEVGDTLEGFGIREEDLTATCEEGEAGSNGFYGHGVVNALRALGG